TAFAVPRERFVLTVVGLFLKFFPSVAETLRGTLRPTRIKIKNSTRGFSRCVFPSLGFSLVHCRQICRSDNRSAQHVADFVVIVETESAIREEQEGGEKNEDAAAY